MLGHKIQQLLIYFNQKMAMTTFDNLWQLLTAFDNLWHFLTAFDSLQHPLTAYEHFWQLMSIFDSFWQLMTFFDSLQHLLTGYYSIWQLLKAYDTLWQLRTAFDNFWKLMTATDSYPVGAAHKLCSARFFLKLVYFFPCHGLKIEISFTIMFITILLRAQVAARGNIYFSSFFPPGNCRHYNKYFSTQL